MIRISIGMLALICICILLIVVPTSHISGQSGIIVNNADTIRTINPSVPSINQSIQARVAVQYSNSIRHVNLSTLPNPFQTLLSTISSRIGFQYANSNRHLTLVYPRALINDTVPPVIGPIAPSSNASSATISWSTDEFTRYTLRYGTQSGNYTQAVEEPLFAKQHTVTLSDLVSGSTYYLQVTAFDLSGNPTVSPEFIIDLIQPTPEPTVVPTLPPPSTPTSNPVFLPLVNR